MASLENVLDGITQMFFKMLSAIPIDPSMYYFLFPDFLSLQNVQSLVDAGVFPKIASLAPALTYALLLSIARFFLQRYLVKPLAEFCMQIKEPIFTHIVDIDRALPFQRNYLYEKEDVDEYCRKSQRKFRDVQEYLMHRRKYCVVRQKYVKFVEALWRAIFYTAFTVIGTIALFTPTTAIWVTDSTHYWKDWPYHSMTPWILFYYHVELGCYLHQLLWTEVTRSDAGEMIMHHVVTILLLVTSYLTNFFRVGCTILWLHDLADIFLETAKVFNYSSKPLHRRWMKSTLVDGTFAMFAITFFVTRLVIYPFKVVYSMFTVGKATFGTKWVGAFFFSSMLCILQALHVFWFYLIAKMIYKLAIGQMEDDERSDVDEDDDSPVIADEMDDKKHK